MSAARVLVTAAPFLGHVNTVMPLALAAARAGHDVVVATGPDLVDHVARIGLKVWAVGPSSSQSGMPRSLDGFWVTGDARAAELLQRSAAWRPDVVVSEELELGGPVVASHHRSRLVVHGLGIDATGDLGPHASAIDAVGRARGIAQLATSLRSATYVSICPPTLIPSAQTIRPMVTLRPSLAESAIGAHLPASLDSLPYAETVHLTMGTVFHRRRPEVLPTALEGLRRLEVNVIVTTGPDVDPGELGPQPQHVVIARHIPHALLLPRCTAVVSQGGAGVMLGALAHGLPQLVLPQGADQFSNAAALERVGAGLALQPDAVTSAVVVAAVDRLLQRPGYRATARKIRAEIADMPDADAAVATLGMSVPAIT